MNFIEEIVSKSGKKLKFRFPPEPNGYLHIGHAKAICLNFGLGEKHSAPVVLRFDDTNPLTEDESFVKSIEDDVRWLGFKPSEITYASDYFVDLYLIAKRFIEMGWAYVDESTSEEIAEMKGTPTSIGTNSPYRDRDPKESLDLFNSMIEGKEKEGSMVLRAKIDMTHDNMLMRDPVIYRVVNKPHYRTGSEWSAYPMYDFAHPFCDYLESISHSLCTLEFEVHRPLYNWFIDKHCLNDNLKPEQIEFARLNISEGITSKRLISSMIDEGKFDGWDDPRLYTLKGLRRRGYTPDSIKYFCDKIGITKFVSETDPKLLEACIREELNSSSLRLMGVLDPIKVVIENYDILAEEVFKIDLTNADDAICREVPFSREIYIEREDFREEGNRKYHRLKLDGEVRLKGAYVIKAVSCDKDIDGNIETVYCTFDPNSKSGMELDRKIKGTIHWVSCEHADEIEVKKYSGDEVFTSKGYVEPSLTRYGLVKEYPVQFLRKGYFKKEGNVFHEVVPLREWKG